MTTSLAFIFHKIIIERHINKKAHQKRSKMVKKYYVEVFDIDQGDTRVLNDISNREFNLAEIKKKYDKTRIDKILKGLRELDLLKEVGKTKNKIGRGMKVYKIDFGKGKNLRESLYSAKKRRFFKVKELPLFK